ncbi:MAG: response regulator [Dehalococcoidales bacterium]|nr:response regulator [Dehalococcoidales bacterium]
MQRQARILVVDDNKDLLNTFALILKRKGHIVDTAEDGMQALDKFQAGRFDVVLMDVIMPHMNGIETLHKMHEINPGIKVILMTAYCEEDQMQKVLNEGAYGALYKPVNIAKLMELIGEVTKDPCIMVVDDDDDFRFSLARLLELQEYKVVTAVNGEDAVRIAGGQTIDVALVDVKMSVMDGLTTSIKLKEINPDIIIIMMTGYRDEVKEIVREATEKGVLKCLYKPFDASVLTELVNQAA